MIEEQQQVGQDQAQEPEVAPQPTLAEITGGQYESVDDLWRDHQEYRKTVAKQKEPEEYDDYLKNLINRYKETGDIRPYLEAASNDYDKMTDEGVLRAEYKAQYPTLSEKALDYKFRREVLGKYQLSPEEATEEEIEIAKELLSADAASVRNRLKEEQSKLLTTSKASEQNKQYEEAIRQHAQFVDSHDATKKLLESKSISVRYGDKDVAFGIKDPQQLVEMTKDNSAFWQLFAGQDGKTDIGKFMRVAAFAMNEDAFLAAIAKSSKADGAEEVLSDIKNPSMPSVQTPTPMAQDRLTAILQKMAQANN